MADNNDWHGMDQRPSSSSKSAPESAHGSQGKHIEEALGPQVAKLDQLLRSGHIEGSKHNESWYCLHSNATSMQLASF